MTPRARPILALNGPATDGVVIDTRRRQTHRNVYDGKTHALAYVEKLAPTLPKEHLIVANLSGRGDKDVFTVAEAMGEKL